MRIGIGLQSRISSKRFPNKVFHELIPGKTVLDFCLERCAEIQAMLADQFVAIGLLVPTLQNQIFEHVAANHGVNLLTGPEDNVLKRYDNFQKWGSFDYIVRVTSDCPLIVTEEAVKMIKDVIQFKFDYGAMKTPEDWFDGTDVEIFTPDILKKLISFALENKSKETIEHVTWPINNTDKIFAHKLYWPKNNKYHEVPKLSVDTAEDYFRVKNYLGECFWI